MRKTIAAVTVGLLLVAGQAAATNNAAVARVGDRVGARADASSEFRGVRMPVVLIGTAVFFTSLYVFTKKDPAESK